MDDIQELKKLFYQSMLATERMRARLEELKREESNELQIVP